MSVAVDANLLLYASDSSSPNNAKAQEIIRQPAEGGDLLYLFWPVAMAYLRIATHPAIFESPLSFAVAASNLESLLERPNVRSPGEESGFWTAFRAVADGADVRGNLVPDAHLVALMRQYGINALISADRDLRRFDGIQVIDPFG